ncbi:hypothetical protein [Enterococcus gallinarum]|uniref:hypothetical protein n=1 Tax=Enterococcus gallinarum TaxID=1353 RepID=UPI002DB6F9F5|nr:hypothetical protein [Enterococcus gallinarum]MEB5968971.1 hypothetical protein [Enterococcus gallinarum]
MVRVTTIANRDSFDEELLQMGIPLKISDEICQLAIEKVTDIYEETLHSVVIHFNNNPEYSSYTVFDLVVNEDSSNEIQLVFTDFYYM